MTCDDAELLLAAYSVGALGDDELPLLRAHVVGCSHCRGEGARYVAAAELIPLSVDLLTPPPALRSRIMAQVHADAAGTPAAIDRPSWIRRLWRAIPSGRGITVAGGVAAVAAAALLVVLAVRGTGPTPPAQATITERGCGTTAAPQACGTLTWDPAIRQAVLDVNGLPAPVAPTGGLPGSYEVWLIRANGAALAAAFLTQEPGGSTWTAAIPGDLGAYVALATTREPLGGSPAGPTGTEVFRLDLPARTG